MTRFGNGRRENAEQAAERARRAQAFQLTGADYEQHRPDQPDAPTAWMAANARDVLDLGAGTGKLTDSLLRLGYRARAVDPSASMLAELARKHPEVPCLEGTGEHIPLDDQSVDAVVVGSAWQWMDPDATGAELVRVLRPGGALGLSWNGPDRSIGWVRELLDVPHASGAAPRTGVRHMATHPGHGFGPLAAREFTWTRSMSPAELLAEQATHSWWILAGEETRQEWSAGLSQRLETEPHTAGRERFDLPQRVRAYRCVLGG